LQFEGADKLIHIGLFGVDGFLLALAASPLGNFRVLTGAIAWCLVFGGALELVQHYMITDRTGDVLDLIADTVGGLIGTLGLVAIPKKFRV
jgi:VanZ family protein